MNWLKGTFNHFWLNQSEALIDDRSADFMSFMPKLKHENHLQVIVITMLHRISAVIFSSIWENGIESIPNNVLIESFRVSGK